MTEILELRMKGGLFLDAGGFGGLAGATVRDADGLPFIPASAVKGAIREQLARLVDREQVQRIFGGPGYQALPGEHDEPTPERIGGGSTRVYIGDARLADHTLEEWFRAGLGYSRKTQVSIDRRSGRAADQRLFNREILAPFADGLRFRARLDRSLLEGDDDQAFEAAVRAVFALGGSRSAGLGGLEMALLPAEDEADEPYLALNPEGESVEVVLEAVDPLCLGADRFSGNFHRTLDHLPASTLRGAVATAALQVRGVADVDQSGEPWFRELMLDPVTCLRFGDAWPSRGDLPRTAPQTLRVCKSAEEEHGFADDLLPAYFRSLLAERGVVVAPDEACPECGQPLTSLARPLGVDKPERRVVTRLALDPKSGRGADGQLFSLELLERGTRFVASVDRVGPAARDFLADAARGTLRIGHGRGQGYGRVRIVEVRDRQDDDLASRLTAFDGRVREGLAGLAEALEAAPETLGADRPHLALLLLSDLAPPVHDGSAEDALLETLGLADEVEIVHGQVRSRRRGGWNALARRPKPYRDVLRAGSVLLLRAATSLESLEPRLRELEEEGVGEAREEGLGRLRFSDNVHLSTWRKK